MRGDQTLCELTLKGSNIRSKFRNSVTASQKMFMGSFAILSLQNQSTGLKSYINFSMR